MGKKDIDISRFSSGNTLNYPNPADVIARTATNPLPSDKKRLEAAEAKKADDNSALAQSYSNVWGNSQEKVESINLSQLSHYKDEEGRSQPFILNEDKIKQIMSSAEDVGIITPLIVRSIGTAEYQIIAGHHRFEAAKRLKLLSAPCIVRKLTDDEAFQIVAESNIQRDKTMPSEYGKIFTAYMNKRADTDMTAKEIASKFSISTKNMYRYINVAKLIPELQSYADEGLIQLDACDKIAAFSENNQKTVQALLDRPDRKPITSAIAKKFAEVVKHYNDGDVPVHEFSWFLYAMPKAQKKYKSKVYNSLSSRFNINKSEQELDELAEKLLAEYFEAQNNLQEV